MKTLLALALACGGCYVPSFSDPVGAVLRQGRETQRGYDDARREYEEREYRQQRLELERRSK